MLSRNSQRVFSNEQLDPRLRAGLVGHWIGGGSGNTWFDRSGYGNHGTLENGPLWTLGEGGKRAALQFSGTRKVQTSVPLFTGAGDITVSSWVYATTDVGTDYIQGNFGLGNTAGLELMLATSLDGKKIGFYDGAFSARSLTTVPTKTWFHAAAVRKSGEVTFYLNGVADGVFTRANSVTGSRNWTIGNGPDYTSEAFDGSLDDVRVYNRALSESEIALLASPSFSPVTPRRFFFGKRSGAAPPPTTSGNFFLMFR